MFGVRDIEKGIMLEARPECINNLFAAPSSKVTPVDDGDGAVSSDEEKPTALTSKWF